jgi:asparagine synthase (glutamine-hydrolysing)
MRDILPVEIINKEKHGFGLPYVDFCNTHPPLNALVESGLAGLRKRGYFRAAFLDGLIERARARRLSGHDGVVWDLLVLELWLQSRM